MKQATLKTLILLEIEDMYKNPQFVEGIDGKMHRVLPAMEYSNMFRWVEGHAAKYNVRINGNSIDRMANEIIKTVSKWNVQS